MLSFMLCSVETPRILYPCVLERSGTFPDTQMFWAFEALIKDAQ